MGRWLAARGFTAFVLFCRLPGEGWAARSKVALSDARRAIRVIRHRAADVGVDLAAARPPRLSRPAYRRWPWLRPAQGHEKTCGDLAGPVCLLGRDAGADLKAALRLLEERVGFEPTVPCGTTVFETVPIDHSGTSPQKAVACAHAWSKGGPIADTLGACQGLCAAKRLMGFTKPKACLYVTNSNRVTWAESKGSGT